METELEEQSRDNKALQLAMDKQERRLQASNTEMMKERRKVCSNFTFKFVYASPFLRTYVQNMRTYRYIQYVHMYIHTYLCVYIV